MIKKIPMMRLLTNISFLLILSFSLHTIHAQTQDSCDSNSSLRNLTSQIFFDITSLNCFPVWSDEGFVLRYAQAGPSLWSFVLSTPNTNSYVGMGFSSNGDMIGSSAIVGWVARDGTTNMKRYLLGGKTPSQVLVDQGDLRIVGNTSSITLDSSRIYMAFQLVTDQDQPSRRLVYSVGDIDNPAPGAPNFRLIQHRNHAAISLNYASGQTSRIKAPYSNLKKTHGILNMIGWGILIPIGAIVARYFKDMGSSWFYAHAGIQSLGFILGLSGVIAGIVLNNRITASVGKHKGLGATILAFGILQVIALLARPAVDAKTRKYWNWYHYTVGRLMISLSIANIFYGIHLAKPGNSWTAGYGVVVGIFIITIFILEFRRYKKN